MVRKFCVNMDLECREVREEEIEEVKQMVRKAFSSNPNVEASETGFFRQLEHIPLPSPEYFRAGFENGIPVTAVMAVRFVVSIGIVPFKIAGYTGMGTDRSARGKRYASQLLEHFEKFLENRGYDGIVLHSSADMLYKKNGFEMVFGLGNFSFSPESLEKYLQSELEIFKSKNLKVKIINSIKEFPQIVDLSTKITEIHNKFYPLGFNVIKNKLFWEQYLNYFFANGFSIALLTEVDPFCCPESNRQRAIAYILYRIESFQQQKESTHAQHTNETQHAEQLNQTTDKAEQNRNTNETQHTEQSNQTTDKAEQNRNTNETQHTEQSNQTIDKTDQTQMANESPQNTAETTRALYKLNIFECLSTEHSIYFIAKLIKDVIDSVKSNNPIQQIEGAYQSQRSDLKNLTEKCNGTTYISFTSKNMFHILNISSFLEKLEPELIRRLEEKRKNYNSLFILQIKELNMELLFRIENNMVNISEYSNPVTNALPKVIIEHEAFYALIFGSFETKEILEDCKFENCKKEELIKVLETLFPFYGPIWPTIYHY